MVLKVSDRVMVTGGAGYIGSHIVVKLCEAGYRPLVVDNFCNSSRSVTRRLEILTGRAIEVMELDILDQNGLASVFEESRPMAVIHCAGLKSICESVGNPLKYYEQNIGGTINLLKQMDTFSCKQIVYSSSATVYGETSTPPFDELARTAPSNPYGRTKLFIEDIIRDWSAAKKGRSAALMRYFNPIGADVSGLIGENPNGIPNNLMPLILSVASGWRDELLVFGDDYETPDGTGVRDYIHVDDLARGHIAALEFTRSNDKTEVFNLGTGTGVSVLELISAFERATNQKVPHQIVGRRPGDVAVSMADPSHSKHILKWQVEFDIDRMCADSWRFCARNQAGNGC